MNSKTAKTLRQGYTTGACASAGAIAAYVSFFKNEECKSVSLLLLTGKQLEIPVFSTEKRVDSSIAAIIKDAGDDPDVTDKMKLCVTVGLGQEADINNEDYVEHCGRGYIIIKGGEGVGLVTRPGLDVAPGKWAINPGPRKMLVENLKAVGFGQQAEYLKVEISAVNGAELAQRTLNPTLGVEDGISILGTTGIVEPYSNAAYIHTIKIHVRCAAEAGANEIAFTTGSRTKNAILRDRPGLTDDTCIRIGDFIADSMNAASEAKLPVVSVACMPGKLYKYACGHKYTHAHKVKLKPELMLAQLEPMGVDDAILKLIAKCDTVGEAAAILDENIFSALLQIFADLALINLEKWATGVKVNLYVYDSRGELILSRIK